LTGEAGNASRRKVIVEATARSLEWASAWRTQDESGPTFSRVIRTNFGDRMAKIFRENSDSLVNPSLGSDPSCSMYLIADWVRLKRQTIETMLQAERPDYASMQPLH
jgi:hypothetical protein